MRTLFQMAQFKALNIANYHYYYSNIFTFRYSLQEDIGLDQEQVEGT